MEQLIIHYSRYVTALLAVLYAALSAGRFFLAGKKGRTADRVQTACIFVWQSAAFLTLCLETGDPDVLFFYAFSQITLFASMTLFLMVYPRLNRAILNHMCFLLGTGFLILCRMDMAQAVRQLIIAAAALVLSMAVPQVMKKWGRQLKRLSLLYAGAGFAALLAVLALGQVTHGSRITWTAAGITFQPSEFVKLLFVFFLAAFLWEDASLKRVAIAAAAAGGHVLVLVLSRDLGSALIFFLVFVLMVFFASVQYRYLAFGAAGGCAAALAAFRLFSHVQVRVQAWRDPWSVIDSQGYQITQSLFALSRGGLFGLGIGQGTPGDIPYVETDFIFAALTEELGLLFAVSLLAVCVCCFLHFLHIAAALEDRFYRLLSAGFGVMYIFQVFLTVGGGIRFIPLTGVTLPLVSYGGSSVMTTVLLFSAVQGAWLKRRGRLSGEEDEEEEEEIRTRRQLAGCRAFFGILFAAMSAYLCIYLPSHSEELFPLLSSLTKAKEAFDRIQGAWEEAQATGYGIVMPTMDQLVLDDPKIIKQGGKYGVNLSATAPSIHLIKSNITAQVNPIVGSESQSEELVNYLMKEFEENPQKLWDSNIFGKSLHELVNEGLHNKLSRMPPAARMKIQETIERIINEGCSGLICILI